MKNKSVLVAVLLFIPSLVYMLWKKLTEKPFGYECRIPEDE